MAALILVVILIVVVAAWISLHNRLVEVEARLRRLEWEREPQVQPHVPSPPQPELPRVQPVEPVQPPEPVPVIPAIPVAAAEARRPAVDWETTLGGNWLNKLGVFIFVIGLALALGYSFTYFGPAGRVAISLCATLAMLGTGVWLEPRENYQTFALGLIGGGWAGLYTTVYAMQAIPAALVVHSALLGAVLLLAVAAGMIAHSLRYRSQTVTGLAYFVAFGTLAITQVTWFAVMAMVPLAASLLFVALRLEWRKIAVFGVAATWAVIVLRGDSGAPVWQAQAVFALFWLLFEIFDLLRPDAALLPLNAAGALGLSIYKWQAADPSDIGWFFCWAAAAYVADGLIRAQRQRRWEGAATLASGLAAAAIFLRLHHQWIALGLLVEAEIVYLSGVRLWAWYLRALGTLLAGIHLGYLLLVGVGTLPLQAWIPVAAVDAAVFYANRELMSADVFWGYAGAGMVALIFGYELPKAWWGRAWLLAGVGAFAIGWWRRLRDYRVQGYALAILGAGATAFYASHPPTSLALGAAVGYAAMACAMRSEPDRFVGREARWLRVAGSVVFTGEMAGLIWRVAPDGWVAPGWAALALGLAIFGGKIEGCVMAALAFLMCWASSFHQADWAVTCPATIACLYGAQVSRERATRLRLYYSLLATVLTTGLIFDKVSGEVLTVAWGLEGVVLLAAGFPLRDRALRLSGLALLFLCILKLFLWDLRELGTLPRIISFLVLGLILVGVSWVYTRFRERVQRYL